MLSCNFGNGQQLRFKDKASLKQNKTNEKMQIIAVCRRPTVRTRCFRTSNICNEIGRIDNCRGLVN